MARYKFILCNSIDNSEEQNRYKRNIINAFRVPYRDVVTSQLTSLIQPMK